MTTTVAADAAVAQIGAAARLRRRLPPPALRRAIREASGLSAAQVALPLGVTRQTLSNWERGTRTPSGPYLEAYIAVLDELQ